MKVIEKQLAQIHWPRLIIVVFLMLLMAYVYREISSDLDPFLLLYIPLIFLPIAFICYEAAEAIYRLFLPKK